MQFYLNFREFLYYLVDIIENFFNVRPLDGALRTLGRATAWERRCRADASTIVAPSADVGRRIVDDVNQVEGLTPA